MLMYQLEKHSWHLFLNAPALRERNFWALNSVVESLCMCVHFFFQLGEELVKSSCFLFVLHPHLIR